MQIKNIPWALRDWSYEANGEYEIGSLEEQAIFERNRNKQEGWDG